MARGLQPCRTMNENKESMKKETTKAARYGYTISIVKNDKGKKWVRVKALGEDFVIAPEDIDGGEHFDYVCAQEKLGELGLDTFNRNQGFIIATLIEEINAKLVEAGAQPFAKDIYIGSELWKLVGSSDYEDNSTCFINGYYGYLGYHDGLRKFNNFRVRPVIAYDEL